MPPKGLLQDPLRPASLPFNDSGACEQDGIGDEGCQKRDVCVCVSLPSAPVCWVVLIPAYPFRASIPQLSRLVNSHVRFIHTE